MRRFRSLKGDLPTFESGKTSELPLSLTRSDSTKKNFLEEAASGGTMGVASKVLGEIGKGLIEQHQNEQKAAELAYVQDLELNIEDGIARAAIRNDRNLEGFDNDVKKLFGNFADPTSIGSQKFGGQIPEHLRPHFEHFVKRQVTRNSLDILQRQYADQKAETNATLMDAMDRSRTEALTAYRRGEVPMGYDKEGTPTAGIPDPEAKFRSALESRTDLSPQQKQKFIEDYRTQRLEQAHIGALERKLEKEGVKGAENYIKDFQGQDSGPDLDPTGKDQLVGEMRRRVALRQREDRERLEANRGEAERIMKNGLARIEAGDGEDSKAQDKLLRLHPELADRYRNLANRYKQRRGEFEYLQTLPPEVAGKEWGALKPKPDDPNYADKLDDWEAVGKALDGYHKRMVEDPAATFAPQVGKTIKQRTEPGGPLYGASPDEVAASARQESLRLMKQQHPGIRRVEGALGNGTLLDPRDTSDRKAVDQYWRNVVEPSLNGQDANQRAAKISDFVGKTGIVPDDIRGYLRGAIRSGAPEDVAQAADLLARLQDRSPSVLADMDRKDIALGMEVSDLMRAGVAPDQALERAREAVNPANQAARETRQGDLKNLRTKYDGWVKDNFDPFGLPDVLPFGPSNDVALSPVGGMKDQVASDFGKLFEDWYLRTGNEETSRKQAFKELHRVWGPSGVDGDKHAMRYPPEAYYGFLGEQEADAKWMRGQLMGDLQAKGLPKGKDAKDVLLVPDSRTAREAATGKPTWKVMMLKDGAFVPFQDQDGNAVRWFPDKTKVKQDLVEKAKALRTTRQLEEEAARMEIEIYGAPRSVLEQKGLL